MVTGMSTSFLKERIASELLKIVREGDMVITFGAGDIWKAGEELLVGLRKKSNSGG